MIEDELGALLADHAERHSVPGAAIGILRGGVVTTAIYGTANVVTGEAVTAETRFSVGSLTKTMVATVIAGLADAGRLTLDDPVSAHVPELRGGWAERATVLDLLANRSGLPLRAALEFGFAAHRDTDDGALARLIAEIHPDLPASGVWSYTNVGWCVLGRVTETVTGDTWELAMRHLLFDRAGMTSTTFASGSEPVRRVVGHDITPGGAVAVEPLVARAYGPAGTSVVSTVTDLLRFARLHLEDRSLAALRVVGADVSIHGWFDAWCLGWARFDWEGGNVWGWDGLISGERSALRILPEHDAAIVLLTNSSTGRALYRTLFAELMEWHFRISVPPLRLDPSPGSAGDLARFAGVYGWPDREIEVTATERGLRVREGGRETEALPIDDRVFLVDALDPDNPTVTFGAFDAAGRPNVLYDMLWGLPRLDPVAASSPNCTPQQGQNFIDAGQLTQAIHEFTCVIDAEPNEVDGYRGRAEALLLLGRFSDAYHDYNTGITALVVPLHPNAFGTIYDHYAARLSVDPDSIPALTGASFARWVNFDYPQAIQVLNQLLDVAPNDPYGTLFRGSSRLLHGKTTAKGVAELNRAIELAPDSPDVRHIVADAYTYGLPDPVRAAAEANLALDWGLDTARVHAILAASHNAFGELLPAAEHIERHFELVTTDLISTAPLAAGNSATLDLVPGRSYAIPIAASAGQTISISTSSPDFWDSIAVLFAPDGAPVVGSDDDNGYFAEFDWEAVATGTYVLYVSSFESVSTGELVVERS